MQLASKQSAEAERNGNKTAKNKNAHNKRSFFGIKNVKSKSLRLGEIKEKRENIFSFNANIKILYTKKEKQGIHSWPII